ncbi:heat shock protein 105 kDa-like [Parasteatoda tepidariorum]|uniref:heat shock protein 105 kDa-like n=1 Tax=Parasteatoda tepidariorum TaxID=114398 RepID=UPI0039BC762E
MSVIGFDLGNETCQIAAAKGGGIEVLDNEYSLRLTPSYVGFSSYLRNIGVSAKNQIIPNIKNTIFNFKTILGKKFSDKYTQSELTFLPYDTLELPSGDVGVEVNYRNEQVKLSILQITAIMLTKLKSIAEYKTGIKVQDCVISVPVYYTDIQRRALLDAAEIAGLKAAQLLNESTAAALFYGFYKQNMFQTDPKIVVFVDLGHSALTVTACKFYEEKLCILGSVWNMRVGGRNFDLILVRHFLDDFKERYNIDVMANRKALMTLFRECEILKKQMSANPQELEMTIECLMEDKDVRGKMKRKFFEEISASSLLAIEKTMEDLISQCQLEKQDVDAVQLIGGSSRIPALKNIIVKVFGKEPQTTLNQDEAIARGCCLQCALLSPTLMTKPYQIEDIQPFALMVMYKTDNVTEEIPILKRFHKIPITRLIKFPYKGLFTLEVFYEFEAGEFEDLGKFCFADLSQEIENSSSAKVEVKIFIDANGIFNILSAKVIAKYENNTGKIDKGAQTLAMVPYDDQASPTYNMEQDLPTDIENVPEATEKLKNTIKIFDLEFISILHKLDRNDIAKYKTEEQEMRQSDLRSQRIADLRNALEEYIFHVRAKLATEIFNYVSEEMKLDLSQRVNEAENWLYDSEQLQDENEFKEHLDELKSEFQGILDRCEKIQDVKDALREFQKFLEFSAKDIQFFGDETNCNKQYEEIKEKLDHANDFVSVNLHAIDRIKCLKELEISANLVREEMKGFQDKLQQMHKLNQLPTIALEKTEANNDNTNKYEDDRQSPIDPNQV